MKAISFCAAWLIISASLLYGTSSCTSKSGNESTTGPVPESIAGQSPSAQTDDPVEVLKAGNRRFCSGKCVHHHQDSLRIRELTVGQHPQTVIVSCSDSRVPPEIIFDQGLGDIFTIRTAGHVMSDFEEGSIEYAVEHLHSKLVVVLGHESCGAIGAMIDHCTHNSKVPGHIASIVETLKNEPEQQEVLSQADDNLTHRAIIANIVHGVKKLRSSDPILSEMYQRGDIHIVGALYHLDNGMVEFLDI